MEKRFRIYNIVVGTNLLGLVIAARYAKLPGDWICVLTLLLGLVIALMLPRLNVLLTREGRKPLF